MVFILFFLSLWIEIVSRLSLLNGKAFLLSFYRNRKEAVLFSYFSIFFLLLWLRELNLKHQQHLIAKIYVLDFNLSTISHKCPPRWPFWTPLCCRFYEVIWAAWLGIQFIHSCCYYNTFFIIILYSSTTPHFSI